MFLLASATHNIQLQISEPTSSVISPLPVLTILLLSPLNKCPLHVSLAPGACSPLLGAHHMEKLSLVGSQQSACYILLYGDARRLLAKTLAQPSVGVSPLAGFLFVTLSAKSLPPPPCSAPGSLLPVSHLTPRPCSVPPTCLLEPKVHRFLIYFPSLTQRFF